MASHGEPSLALANSTLRSWSDRPALPDPATESGIPTARGLSLSPADVSHNTA
ncbi:hypothetical protein [Oryza sativa Japonica Group]|uniref:Uncharacterized protein n=2 Tax=Oryza sativa subsp. japonica TaxID=39947 RepID=Q5NBR1_ORYSJ|nr:hypothetical protein [Oryza sativa Japonica Group]BAD81591.1 hypothetical protein [Oryza sativa Japonica Group]